MKIKFLLSLITLLILTSCQSPEIINKPTDPEINTEQNSVDSSPSNSTEKNLQEDKGTATEPWTVSEYNFEIPSFRGKKYLRGWIVDVPVYVGPETAPHFYVAEESRKDLPDFSIEQSRYEYRIISDEKLISELRKYNQENPATVLATEIIFHMEGNPAIKIETIAE